MMSGFVVACPESLIGEYSEYEGASVVGIGEVDEKEYESDG